MVGSLIAIAGMMGSGKTTLARNLSGNLGWILLPEGLRSRLYLKDLFHDETRWAFDAQISFLCEKAIRLKKYLMSGQNVILDRSVYEDVEIFASHFYAQKKIDERSFNTYKELAEYFLSELPIPDLIIYCEGTLEEIERRISHRQRKIDLEYPKNHIKSIYDRYQQWSKGFKGSAFYAIDGEKYDFRNREIIGTISNEVRSILTNPPTSNLQMPLPGLDNDIWQDQKIRILKEIIPVTASIPHSRFKETANLTYNYPCAYIAAPFTSKAEPNKNSNDVMTLFVDFDVPHGIIEKGVFRGMLNGVSNILKRKGFNVILPHRDINEWGRKILTPNEVFNLCSKSVENSDLFVGILGLSHGSHYEFGIAVGLNRPAIIIAPTDMEQSFIAQGINSIPDKLLFLKCEKITEVPKLLSSKETSEFLNTFFPMEDMR